jgi:hypothetical protein
MALEKKMILEQLPESVPTYIPDEETSEFIVKVYKDYRKDLDLKLKSLKFLGGRGLQKFWDDCIADYNNFVPSDPSDDWMKYYPDGITRDKVNVFISNLVSNLVEPRVFAQNQNQEIDNIISRILGILLSYAVKNDGRPSLNGHFKFIQAVHKAVVEGTVHRMIYINDDRKHETEIIPNEEVFISNFLQYDIQKQPHFLRVQENVSYEEAKREFGSLDNFKYVIPGEVSKWNVSQPFFKEYDSLLIKENRVQIIRLWYPVPFEKLSKKRKQQKYFNVLINGVLMFPIDNIDAYRHGYYPISKMVFEMFDANFYWGNSLPNKLRHDKKWADALRTMIMNKEKLNLMPPMFARNGFVVDKDVYVPSKITNVQGNPQEDLIQVPGVTPVTQSDVTMLDLISKSADSASTSPTFGGQPSRQPRTLGEIEIMELNANRLMISFGIMIATGIETEGWLTLRNIIQFYPRNKVNELARVSIPNQNLKTGAIGNIDIIFDNVMNLDKEQRKKKAFDILSMESEAKKQGVEREITYIDPSYAENLDLFIQVVGNPVQRIDDASKRYLTLQKYLQVYLNNPNIDQRAALRQVIQSQGDDENILLIQQQPQIPQINSFNPAGSMPQQTPPNLRGLGVTKTPPVAQNV